MESKVAEAARAAQVQRDSELSPVDRVRRALALGRRSIEMLAAARNISVLEARREAQAVIRAAREAN